MPNCFTSSKTNFTDETADHSSIALSMFYLSRQWENDKASHLYAERYLSTHGKKYHLIFPLNFEKHIDCTKMGLLQRNSLAFPLFTCIVCTPGKDPSFSNKRSPMVNPVKKLGFLKR